jgi:hypothetical protein
MTLSLRILLARTGAATLLVGGLLFGPLAGVARAEGEEPDAGNIEEEIRAQAEKILELMRQNEQAILAASLGSGKKPDGVDVKPPPAPESEGASKDDATPPPSSKDDDGGTRGQDIGRKIEELIRTTQERGGTIPSELEALVRMIPT